MRATGSLGGLALTKEVQGRNEGGAVKAGAGVEVGKARETTRGLGGPLSPAPCPARRCALCGCATARKRGVEERHSDGTMASTCRETPLEIARPAFGTALGRAGQGPRASAPHGAAEGAGRSRRASRRKGWVRDAPAGLYGSAGPCVCVCTGEGGGVCRPALLLPCRPPCDSRRWNAPRARLVGERRAPPSARRKRTRRLSGWSQGAVSVTTTRHCGGGARRRCRRVTGTRR